MGDEKQGGMWTFPAAAFDFIEMAGDALLSLVLYTLDLAALILSLESASFLTFFSFLPTTLTISSNRNILFSAGLLTVSSFAGPQRCFDD